MTRWLSPEQQRAWRGFLQMSARLDAQVNRQLQEAHGLSSTDYAVLVPLSEAPEGRLRVFELSDGLAWEQSRLSHHLTRMEKRGLVERQRCNADRRGAFVALTALGREAIESAAPTHVENVRSAMFDALTDEQVTALREISERVLANLEATTP